MPRLVVEGLRSMFNLIRGKKMKAYVCDVCGTQAEGTKLYDTPPQNWFTVMLNYVTKHACPNCPDKLVRLMQATEKVKNENPK